MNRYRILCIFTLTLFITAVVSIDASKAEKQPSDIYLEYLASAQNADSPDDITSYWSGWMAESFDRGSEDSKKARLERMKESASKKKDIKVVRTEKSGEYWVITLKAVYPDGEKMKGEVKMIKENGKFVIEEEYWTGDI